MSTNFKVMTGCFGIAAGMFVKAAGSSYYLAIAAALCIVGFFLSLWTIEDYFA